MSTEPLNFQQYLLILKTFADYRTAKQNGQRSITTSTYEQTFNCWLTKTAVRTTSKNTSYSEDVWATTN